MRNPGDTNSSLLVNSPPTLTSPKPYGRDANVKPTEISSTNLKDRSNANHQIIELMIELASAGKDREAYLPGVRLLVLNQTNRREPLLYEPCIIFIANGTKVIYLETCQFEFVASSYFLLTSPAYLESEAVVDRDLPMLAISIRIDIAVLSDIALQCLHEAFAQGPKVGTLTPAAALDDILSDVLIRLLKTLRDPDDAAILGPAVVREILYRVLRGEHGPALLGILGQSGKIGQLLPVIQRIHSHCQEDIEVSNLARKNAMSISGFHQHFKSATGKSPLQYLKGVRLQKARMIMVYDLLQTSVASNVVGYGSPSHFNRDFKRYFGRPPQEEVSRLRRRLGLDIGSPTHSTVGERAGCVTDAQARQ